MSRISQLRTGLYILWARGKGDRVPFEVSREVTNSLQPRCPTSPLCPGEEGTGQPPAMVSPPHDCPYGFKDKLDCIKDNNTRAFKAGCFDGSTALTTANFLRLMGYEVAEEQVPDCANDGQRILQAHGKIYNFHEVRFELGPQGLPLVLIRNPVQGAREAQARKA